MLFSLQKFDHLFVHLSLVCPYNVLFFHLEFIVVREDEAFPLPRHLGMYGGVEVLLHSFETSALYGGEWLTCFGLLYLRKEPR